jgi:hypothetical protein
MCHVFPLQSFPTMVKWNAFPGMSSQEIKTLAEEGVI